MDAQLRETYNQLAAGEDPNIDLEIIGRKLLYLCFEDGSNDDPMIRLKALRVASQLEVTDRMRLADPMIRDADPRVRRYAFDLAVEAEMEGIVPLKTCIESHDIDLAVEALSLLNTQLNKGIGLHARGWLKHNDPRIRALAADLLGNISGPSVAVPLQRLADNDPHPEVRKIALIAAQRCHGHLAKRASKNFWEAGPTTIHLPDPIIPEAPEELTPVPPVPTPAPPVAPRFPPPAELVPSAPNTEVVHDPTPRDWRDPAPLPATLPTEPLPLVKLIGMVAKHDRGSVGGALERCDDAAVRTTLGRWSQGGDPVLGRGIAVTIAVLRFNTYATRLRQMLQATDPGVRAGAAEAVGATAAVSMIPPLARLLGDADPHVRIAAIQGLGELLIRHERYGMLRDRIAPLSSDPDEGVKSAVEKTLAAIP